MKNLKRMWINQPSTQDNHYKYHGKRVLADLIAGEQFVTIYFTDGNLISMRVDKNILAHGWANH